jgi:hypothetical protein
VQGWIKIIDAEMDGKTRIVSGMFTWICLGSAVNAKRECDHPASSFRFLKPLHESPAIPVV